MLMLKVGHSCQICRSCTVRGGRGTVLAKFHCSTLEHAGEALAPAHHQATSSMPTLCWKNLAEGIPS